MVNLAVVFESLRAMARDSEPQLYSQGIFPIEIDEGTLTPDTTIVFIMEGGLGGTENSAPSGGWRIREIPDYASSPKTHQSFTEAHPF
jgi:hypothetical protein